MKLLLNLLLLFSIGGPICGKAQTGDSSQDFNFRKYARIQLGAIYSKNSYNIEQDKVPGVILDYNYLIKLKEFYGIGTGGAIQVQEKQIFFPIYFNLVASTKNNLYFDFQPGYSIGWERSAKYYENYDLMGGFYSKFGLGYKIRLSDEFSTCIQISYSYQNARLESINYPTEHMDLHSIMASIGLLLDRK